MSESFNSARFGKRVWLTNHAIESMAKRQVTLAEVKRLVEEGRYEVKAGSHGWIFHHFTSRSDHLVRAAAATDQTIIIKTVMVNWTHREEGT